MAQLDQPGFTRDTRPNLFNNPSFGTEYTFTNLGSGNFNRSTNESKEIAICDEVVKFTIDLPSCLILCPDELWAPPQTLSPTCI